MAGPIIMAGILMILLRVMQDEDLSLPLAFGVAFGTLVVSQVLLALLVPALGVWGGLGLASLGSASVLACAVSYLFGMSLHRAGILAGIYVACQIGLAVLFGLAT